MKSFEIARQVDILNIGITAASAIVTLGILFCIVQCCFRFHHSRNGEYKADVQSTKLEILWTGITLFIFMIFFFWGMNVYKKQVSPMRPDYHIYVYAKQWMWKFHHQNGFVEVDKLHVPKNKNVRLIMMSKDVIHSFYLPKFRIKQDILPETFTYVNLNVDKTGDYPLYCAEYCGTDHATMRGEVDVINEKDYQKLIGLQDSTSNPLLSKGKALFNEHGCVACHESQGEYAPELTGLQDETSIRDSILYPKKVIKAGYGPTMPSFKDELTEDDLRSLVEYVKSAGKK